MKRSKELYKLIYKIGLNKKDLDDILKNHIKSKDNVSFSKGPPWYPGTKYGTISIEEF